MLETSVVSLELADLLIFDLNLLSSALQGCLVADKVLPHLVHLLPLPRKPLRLFTQLLNSSLACKQLLSKVFVLQLQLITQFLKIILFCSFVPIYLIIKDD